MFNSSSTIIRSLESVASQTAIDLIGEVIVVDDGSTDASYAKVESYISKGININVRVIKKENGGAASARNFGIKISEFDWIALLDADDEWLPHKLEFQYAIISKETHIDLLGNEINDNPVNLLYKKFDKLTRVKSSEVLLKMFPQTSTIIFKKYLFDEIGGFDEKLRYGEDGRFFVEVCSYYNYYYHPEKLVIYDGGKLGFGVSGLTANLEKMHESQLTNLKYFLDKKIIGKSMFYFLHAYYRLKYIRRILKTRI